MDEQGITDPEIRAGIAAVSQGESGFQPRSEQDYSHTSNDRIRSIFSSTTGNMSDAELTKLKADPEAFFNRVYGNKLGNAADEGFKYRGRGLNQLTGKDNYKQMGELIGVDLVNNPDLANDPKIAAAINVAYIKKRYHGGGFEGLKRATGTAVASTEQEKNAAYLKYLQTGEFKPGAGGRANTVAGAANTSATATPRINPNIGDPIGHNQTTASSMETAPVMDPTKITATPVNPLPISTGTQVTQALDEHTKLQASAMTPPPQMTPVMPQPSAPVGQQQGNIPGNVGTLPPVRNDDPVLLNAIRGDLKFS
jgi:hypothetical protein